MFSAIYLKCCSSCCLWCNLATVGGTEVELTATAAVLDNPDIMQSFDYDKLSSISQLIKGKPRNYSNVSTE